MLRHVGMTLANTAVQTFDVSNGAVDFRIQCSENGCELVVKPVFERVKMNGRVFGVFGRRLYAIDGTLIEKRNKNYFLSHLRL